MISRRLQCIAEAMTCALFVALGTGMLGVPEPLFRVAGLALICFAFALLAEERARWHRDIDAYEHMLEVLREGTDEEAVAALRVYYGIPISGCWTAQHRKVHGDHITIECIYAGKWSPYEEGH